MKNISQSILIVSLQQHWCTYKQVMLRSDDSKVFLSLVLKVFSKHQIQEVPHIQAVHYAKVSVVQYSIESYRINTISQVRGI